VKPALTLAHIPPGGHAESGGTGAAHLDQNTAARKTTKGDQAISSERRPYIDNAKPDKPGLRKISGRLLYNSLTAVANGEIKGRGCVWPNEIASRRADLKLTFAGYILRRNVDGKPRVPRPRNGFTIADIEFR